MEKKKNDTRNNKFELNKNDFCAVRFKIIANWPTVKLKGNTIIADCTLVLFARYFRFKRDTSIFKL